MREINKEMWDSVGVLSGIQTIDETPTFIQEVSLLKET